MRLSLRPVGEVLSGQSLGLRPFLALDQALHIVVNIGLRRRQAKPDQASHQGMAEGAGRVQGHGWGEEGEVQAPGLKRRLFDGLY